MEIRASACVRGEGEECNKVRKWMPKEGPKQTAPKVRKPSDNKRKSAKTVENRPKSAKTIRVTFIGDLLAMPSGHLVVAI